MGGESDGTSFGKGTADGGVQDGRRDEIYIILLLSNQLHFRKGGGCLYLVLGLHFAPALLY